MGNKMRSRGGKTMDLALRSYFGVSYLGQSYLDEIDEMSVEKIQEIVDDFIERRKRKQEKRYCEFEEERESYFVKRCWRLPNAPEVNERKKYLVYQRK